MTARSQTESEERPLPPGRLKIMDALKSLLEEKEFISITTAEIAKTAGVTEALIYKYFDDKRDLLHQVLAGYLGFFITQAETDINGTKGALNKLRKLIWSHINMYAGNRVFAKILLLEVRNYPDYFRSNAYQEVKRYTSSLMAIIEEGVEEGTIRGDIPRAAIRQAIWGGIEHVCLPSVIFNRTMDPDKVSEELSEIIIGGIAASDQGNGDVSHSNE